MTLIGQFVVKHFPINDPTKILIFTFLQLIAQDYNFWLWVDGRKVTD